MQMIAKRHRNVLMDLDAFWMLVGVLDRFDARFLIAVRATICERGIARLNLEGFRAPRAINYFKRHRSRSKNLMRECRQLAILPRMPSGA